MFILSSVCIVSFVYVVVTIFFTFPFTLIKNVACLCCPVRVGVARLIYTPYNLFILPVYQFFCHFGLIPRFDFFRRCKVSCYKSRLPISSRNAATLLVSMPVYLKVVLISVWFSRYCKVYKVSWSPL